MSMPKVALSSLSKKANKIAREITKKDGSIYSTKPKKATGEAKYVWRMIVFQVSSIPAHQCMPVTADFDLPERYWSKDTSWDEKIAIRQELSDIGDEIANTIPKEQWAGIIRWGRALGAL